MRQSDPICHCFDVQSLSLIYGSRGQYANKFHKAEIRILTAVGIKRDIVKTIQQGNAAFIAIVDLERIGFMQTPQAATFCKP
jgi:hypothetical protein